MKRRELLQAMAAQGRIPASVIISTAVLVGTTALAGYLPARRATRVDPTVALRYE